MDKVLETTLNLLKSKDKTEKSIREYLLKTVFGDVPEDPELGTRVKVSISGIDTQDGLGPQRVARMGDLTDLVSSFTREITFNARITLVFPEDRHWSERQWQTR